MLYGVVVTPTQWWVPYEKAKQCLPGFMLGTTNSDWAKILNLICSDLPTIPVAWLPMPIYWTQTIIGKLWLYWLYLKKMLLVFSVNRLTCECECVEKWLISLDNKPVSSAWPKLIFKEKLVSHRKVQSRCDSVTWLYSLHHCAPKFE